MSSGGYKRSFQHIAKFYNYNTVVGTVFIVTAAVYRGFGRKLLPTFVGMTRFLNLPAPGRCHSLYIAFTA